LQLKTIMHSLTRQAVLVALAASLLLARRAAAEIVIYKFAGTVQSVSNPPYDLPFAAQQPVLGKFIYDTSTVGTPVISGNDGYDYRQHFANGFTARIGPAIVFTDNYLVSVVNDLQQPKTGTGAPADNIVVRDTSNVPPPQNSPFYVNGIPKTGAFQLNFLGTPTLFNEPSLPPSINLGDFYQWPKTSGLLSETPFRVAIFDMLSLERVEELPADFDRDGDVDGADLLVLQRAEGASQPLANGVDEPTVGAANLQLWSDNFRSTLHPQAAVTVPEPTSLLIAATVTLILQSRRKLFPLPQ
jgi:hypothetical protein